MPTAPAGSARIHYELRGRGPPAGRLLADRIPDARLMVLEGVGHLPAVEVPADCARLVLEFLP